MKFHLLKYCAFSVLGNVVIKSQYLIFSPKSPGEPPGNKNILSIVMFFAWLIVAKSKHSYYVSLWYRNTGGTPSGYRDGYFILRVVPIENDQTIKTATASASTSVTLAAEWFKFIRVPEAADCLTGRICKHAYR
ncbi:hypothetical protein QTP88_005924 [Uroleucon formosanum]